MTAISRKVQLSWDDLLWFYYTPSLDAVPELRKIGTASVFYAWWNGKLDSEETPKAMMCLDVLRKEHSQIDQDLHEWCRKNQEDVERRWEEKKQKRPETAVDERDGGTGAGNTGAGWEKSAPPTQSGGEFGNGSEAIVSSGEKSASGWHKPATAHAGNSWAGQDTACNTPAASHNSSSAYASDDHCGKPRDHADGSSSVAGGEWADEVNDHNSTPAVGGYPDQKW